VVFTPEQLSRYCAEAPNTNGDLVTKVAATLGTVVGCRPNELYNLKASDVQRLPGGTWEITIEVRKTGKRAKSTFLIEADPNKLCIWSPVHYLQTYLDLRTAWHTVDKPFFFQVRNGAMTKQRVGENSFNSMTKQIAAFLELPQAEKYTGYALRRTSATLAAEGGATAPQMKTHFGWKGDQTANRYVDSTTESKVKMSRAITGTKAATPATSSTSSTTSHLGGHTFQFDGTFHGNVQIVFQQPPKRKLNDAVLINDDDVDAAPQNDDDE